MDTLAVLADGAARVVLRTATAADLTAVVDLIAADQLGATRDGVRDEADLAAYSAAFESIDADPAHLLIVADHSCPASPAAARCGPRSRRSGWRGVSAALAWARP
jgi:hypothetical protein